MKTEDEKVRAAVERLTKFVNDMSGEILQSDLCTLLFALADRNKEAERLKVEPEPFGHERGQPWESKPTARALAEAIAELAINDRNGLIQRVRGLILRDRVTVQQTFAKLQSRAEAAEQERDTANAKLAGMVHLLRKAEWYVAAYHQDTRDVTAAETLAAIRNALAASTKYEI